MSWGYVAIGAGTAIAGIAGSIGSSNAADAQSDAAKAAAQVQMKMFKKQLQLQKPWIKAGEVGLDRLRTLLALGGGHRGSPDYGKWAGTFGMSDFKQDPGYAFRLSEGLKALDQQAAARGGLISGAALKAATRYGQQMGSQEYTNAFNRYQTERSAALNPLFSMAGLGQVGTNQLASAGQNYGNNQAEIALQAGNARASGYVGQANSLTNAINSGMNNYMMYKWMNPSTTGGTTTPAYTPGSGGYMDPNMFVGGT